MNPRASWIAQLKNYHFRSAQGRLAANQESGNRLGNAGNILARAEISKGGSLSVPSVSYKKRRATSRRRIRIDSGEHNVILDIGISKERHVSVQNKFYHLDKILFLFNTLILFCKPLLD